jgi:predicted RNA binding protein YcfA (HicA-like mRNA interferase family)
LGKLRVFSGREVCAILKVHGFREVRQRGSHIVMQRLTDEGTTTVPVPDHREVRVGTLRSITIPSRIAFRGHYLATCLKVRFCVPSDAIQRALIPATEHQSLMPGTLNGYHLPVGAAKMHFAISAATRQSA